jgi:predicted ribosomally synthesized peptide with nif11-like leader
MSLASAKEFLAKMEADAEFLLKMGAAESPAVRWDLIRDAGFDFNQGDLSNALAETGCTKAKEFLTKYAPMPGSAAFGDVIRPLSNATCGTCE